METSVPLAQRVGIVVVHGVMPHPRYEIQDLAARELVSALNADAEWQKLGTWVYSVVQPHDPTVVDDCAPRPTVSRVRLGSESVPPPPPGAPTFDVIEAFWSPLDKGKATFTGVAGWLLRTVFVPLNTTARYMSGRLKTAYDVVLIALAMVAVVLFLAAALAAAAGAAALLLSVSWQDAAQLFLDPTKLLAKFAAEPAALWPLACGLAGGYVFAQVASALCGMIAQFGVRRQINPAQHADRWWAIAFAAALGAALLLIMLFFEHHDLRLAATLFVVAALAFVGARTLAQSFFVNFFADVEIYTTRDENVEFFTMREKILELVTKTIVQTTQATIDGDGTYDRVFVLGHSLGSTIALDALLRYHALVEQAGDPKVRADYDRIRGFVTFGSPLEKTKYFFDVNHPTPSLSFAQWRGDAYGPLFTADISALDGTSVGIFWANYWYFFDPVANKLDSYRSFLPPGAAVADGHHRRRLTLAQHSVRLRNGKQALIGRLVCWNEFRWKRLELPNIVPHGDYLLDHPWFWVTRADEQHLGVLDVVARRSDAATAFVKDAAIFDPVTRTTYEEVSEREARKHAVRIG